LGFAEFFGVSEHAVVEAELHPRAEFGDGSKRRGVETRNDDPFLTGRVVVTFSKCLCIIINITMYNQQKYK